MTTYYITSPTCAADQKWHATKAKTLNGAKCAAGRMYQYANGGKVMVGIKLDQHSFEPVAVKHGHATWVNYI